jgi:hypothetical protein
MSLGFLSGEEREARKRQLRMVQLYQQLFSTPEGHEVLHDILKRAGVFNQSFDSDSSVFYHREGRRALGLEIMSVIQIDTIAAMKLLEEKHDNRNADRRYDNGNDDYGR